MGYDLSLGIQFKGLNDTKKQLEKCIENGYCFTSVSLSHEYFTTNDTDYSKMESLNSVDLDISPVEWVRNIVGRISTKKSSLLNDNNQVLYKVIEKEMIFGTYLNVSVIIVEINEINYRSISKICLKTLKNCSPTTEIWVKIKLVDRKSNNYTFDTSINLLKIWSKFISICRFSKCIRLMLQLNENCADSYNYFTLSPWIGENISGIILPSFLFYENKNKIPILSREIRNFVSNMLMLENRIIIKTNGQDDKLLKDYYNYIKHLSQKLPARSLFDYWSRNHFDIVQIPLQPLGYNLESSVYVVFEKDPVKYDLYKRAIYACVKDLKEKNNQSKITLIVAGSGRGPLVQMAYEACTEQNVEFIIYAVEKNTFAIPTLLYKAKNVWNEKVHVIHKDMRYWESTEKADILISELLGSFGDNELSPECLDGANHLLKENGISIPQSYTSYIAPVSANRTYSEVLELTAMRKDYDVLQCPYVCCLKTYKQLAEIKECFHFDHPNFQNHTNERISNISFKIQEKFSVMHGFVGYFSCILYKDIIMSIHPDTHSPDMFSWYSLFIPIKTPICLNQGDVVNLNICRAVDERNVWYEWTVDTSSMIQSHNAMGEHYKINLC